MEMLVARLNLCMCYAIVLIPGLWISWKVLMAFGLWVKVMDASYQQAQQKKRDFEEKYDSGYYSDERSRHS